MKLVNCKNYLGMLVSITIRTAGETTSRNFNDIARERERGNLLFKMFFGHRVIVFSTLVYIN